MNDTTSLDRVRTLPVLPRRQLDSNKGDHGKVLIVAGSKGMSGAAVLCGSAALRSGAGLVRVAVPGTILPVVAVGNPCYTTIALPSDRASALLADLDQLQELTADQDAVAFGPGLGRSPDILKVEQALLTKGRFPIVLDADGLNSLVGHLEVLRKRPAPTILTPHPGEFARLLETDVPTVQARRQELAAEFARQHQVIVLLKGHRTLVTDGKRLYENGTGNAGMATGGSGDVLTGVIVALLGQGLEPFAAAQLGAHVHGLAGDLARRDRGEVGLIASDVVEYLPQAFAHL